VCSNLFEIYLLISKNNTIALPFNQIYIKDFNIYHTIYVTLDLLWNIFSYYIYFNTINIETNFYKPNQIQDSLIEVADEASMRHFNNLSLALSLLFPKENLLLTNKL
jgi:hypothetical protein